MICRAVSDIYIFYKWYTNNLVCIFINTLLNQGLPDFIAEQINSYSTKTSLLYFAIYYMKRVCFELWYIIPKEVICIVYKQSIWKQSIDVQCINRETYLQSSFIDKLLK